MTRELGVFLVAAMVIMIILVAVITYFSFFTKEKYFLEPFTAYEDAFDIGTFNTIDMSENFGELSRFYVFDGQHQLVYQSVDETFPYSIENALLIPDELDDLNTNWIIKDDERFYKIEYLNYDNDIGTMVIVDDSRKVIYSNRDLPEVLSEEAFDCLYGDDGHYQLLKKIYKHQGENYLVVFMIPNDFIEHSLTEVIVMIIIVLLIVIICSIGTLLLYLKRLNNKIIQPIGILEKKIEAFESGSPQNKVTYNGPVEFERILERFYEMSKKLQEAHDNNRKMIADISHDLKTPISVIQLYGKIIKEEAISDEEKADMLQKVVEKTYQMNDLINMFSEYSKLYHAEYNFEYETVDIVEYSRVYFINKYNELEVQGFHLNIEVPDESIYCSLDTMNFRRVYDNIVGNTVKYNSSGVTISFSIYLEGDNIKIVIGDDGVGISDKIKAKVFDAFTVGDVARSSGTGTGLGMAIVQKIVELHDGEVVLNTSHDLSVAIEITLPVMNLKKN